MNSKNESIRKDQMKKYDLVFISANPLGLRGAEEAEAFPASSAPLNPLFKKPGTAGSCYRVLVRMGIDAKWRKALVASAKMGGVDAEEP
jgi:hypothetical protein